MNESKEQQRKVEIIETVKDFTKWINKHITFQTSDKWGLIWASEEGQPFQGTRSKISLNPDEVMIASSAQYSYGEPTLGSLEALWSSLHELGLGKPGTSFLDFGSGFGKVVFHVAAKSIVHCYGIEILCARVSYCLGLQAELFQKFQRNSEIVDVIERTHFLRRDCEAVNSIDELHIGRPTHFFAFNPVFSERTNEAIAELLNQTSSFDILAWTCNEDVTKRHGLLKFKLLKKMTLCM